MKIKSLLNISLFKGKIKISIFTFITIIALIVLGHLVEVLSYAIVLIMHESAHVICAEKLGYSLSSINIMPYGISANGRFENLKPIDEIKIAVVGPLINVFTWTVMLCFWWMFPEIYVATKSIAEASLFIALINMMPIYPLDGGRVLHGLILMKTGANRASKITKTISTIFSILMCALAVVMMIVSWNFSYSTLAVFIISSIFIPVDSTAYEGIYTVYGASKRLKKSLIYRIIAVKDDCRLCDLYKKLSPHYYTEFVFMNENLRIIGTMSETELYENIITKQSTQVAISLANRRNMWYNTIE